MLVVIAALIFTGCFSKILIIVLYNKLQEDSFRVADCNSELIKQIKLRYSNQIKLELPIQDVEKFVGRYIYQYSKMIKFINVLDMLSLIVMLSGMALNYEKQYFEEEVLFIAMFIYLSIGLLVNSDKKERIVINNIADYLVNNMNTRMAAREHRVQVKESMRAECEKPEAKNSLERETEFSSVPKETEGLIKEKNSKPKGMSLLQRGVSMDGMRKEDNAIIEEVLREFLQV